MGKEWRRFHQDLDLDKDASCHHLFTPVPCLGGCNWAELEIPVFSCLSTFSHSWLHLFWPRYVTKIWDCQEAPAGDHNSRCIYWALAVCQEWWLHFVLTRTYWHGCKYSILEVRKTKPLIGKVSCTTSILVAIYHSLIDIQQHRFILIDLKAQKSKVSLTGLVKVSAGQLFLKGSGQDLFSPLSLLLETTAVWISSSRHFNCSFHCHIS